MPLLGITSKECSVAHQRGANKWEWIHLWACAGWLYSSSRVVLHVVLHVYYKNLPLHVFVKLYCYRNLHPGHFVVFLVALHVFRQVVRQERLDLPRFVAFSVVLHVVLHLVREEPLHPPRFVVFSVILEVRICYNLLISCCSNTWSTELQTLHVL